MSGDRMDTLLALEELGFSEAGDGSLSDLAYVHPAITIEAVYDLDAQFVPCVMLSGAFNDGHGSAELRAQLPEEVAGIDEAAALLWYHTRRFAFAPEPDWFRYGAAQADHLPTALKAHL